MKKRWNDMDERELEEELGTSAVNGLSKKTAAQRRKRQGANVIFRLPHGSFWSYFKDIASDSSAIIMVLAAIVCSVFKSTYASYIIVGMIVLNCLVCVFTYVKAHRVLEGLGEYSLPGCKVIREGHLYLMRMTSLVPGDLIYLKAGDIVPADARIIASDGFYVSEKGITGNTSAMRKAPMNVTPDDDKPERMQNIVFASSVVLKGSARAIVVETGDNTLAVRTKSNSFETPDHSLEIFALLKKYSNILSLSMFALASVIMVIEIMFGSRSLYDIFLGAMSLSVAAMTEFYLAFGYIIVACGLFGARAALKTDDTSVILKNIKSTDKLKDINCVILRREGILSEKNKQVDMFYVKDTAYEVSKCSDPRGFKMLLEAAVITTGQYTHKAVSSGGLSQNIKADDRAILDTAIKYGVYNIELDKKYKLVMHTEAGQNSPFDVTAVELNGEVYAFIKGNADVILNSSTHYEIGGGDIPIDSAIKVNLSEIIGEFSKSNNSVFGVCVCKTNINMLSMGIGNILRGGAKLLGFFTTKAPMFDGCALTLERLKNAGIKVILNSPGAFDDDINTAHNLGIIKDRSEVLSEMTLSEMSDETLKEKLDGYNLYSGLKNASLRRIIKLLRENGYNVAFSANILSEITVMECADIGFAQTTVPDAGTKKNRSPSDPGNDCDALRYKADVVIPDNVRGKRGGINALANSILTSKLIYKNIMNMLAYLITVQSARLIIVMYSVFSSSDILTPIQVLMGGMIFDLLAVIAIAFSSINLHTCEDYENTKRDMSNLRFFCLRNIMFGAFWAAVSVAVPIIITNIDRTMSVQEVSSCVFTSFTLLQFFVLLEIKRYDSIFKAGTIRINRFYILSLLFSLLFLAAGYIFSEFGAIFSLCTPDRMSVISSTLTVIAVISIFELYKKLTLREDKPNKKNEDKNKEESPQE